MSVVERRDATRVKEIDKIVKNKFRWDWLEREITTDVGNKKTVTNLLSDFIRKIDRAGKAICTWCSNDVIDYGSRGYKALENHAKTRKHMEKVKSRTTNYCLAGTFGVKQTTSKHYGLHPLLTTSNNDSEVERQIPQQPVGVAERVVNFEAMLLGFLAENSLPFTMAPKLIAMTKEMSRDPKALSELSMDRTSASYKMKFGLAQSMHEETLENLRSTTFSFNIDESTSNNLHRVLCVLVSYYSPLRKAVVVEHLASLSVVKVDSKSLFDELSTLMTKNDIPWRNLVSVLMDSCAVMRGSKSGVETRLRQGPVPHLLDIDGDTCHHVHNASKQFCKPFEFRMEGFHSDIFNDFKWSTDLKEALQEVCFLTGISFTMPERFVSHRWLSNYDVSLSNLRLMDAFTIFYFAFLKKADKELYLPTVLSIYHKKDLSGEVKSRLRQIQLSLSQKNMTEEGKRRKQRIFEKLFDTRLDTLLTLNFYTAVLPLLKNYVTTFETKKPMIHLLNDKQIAFFKKFLACFIKPEFLQENNLTDVDLDDKKSQLRDRDLFYGGMSSKFMESTTKSSVVATFKTKARAAYLACGKYLQKKLPMKSKLLKAASAIDPTARGHSSTLHQLKKLPSLVTNVLDERDEETYDLEVREYQLDAELPSPFDLDGKALDLDCWWTKVFSLNKYPSLAKMIKALMSCFHGPQVEGAFSVMGDVLNTKSCRMDISTYSSIQTVKYALRAITTTSVNHFKRRDILMDPVKARVVHNIMTSGKRYREEKQEEEASRTTKRKQLSVKLDAQLSKTASRFTIQAAQKKARKTHAKALKSKCK